MTKLSACSLGLAILLLAGCSTTPDESEGESALEAEPDITALVDRAEAEPEDPTLQYQLGNALFDLRRYPEARTAYANAVALDADFADAHTNLGLTYRLLSDLPNALNHYRMSLALQPNDITTLQNIIIVLRLQGAYEAAARYAGRLAELSPQDAAAQSDLAALFYELGRYDEAASQYGRAIAIVPGDVSARYQQGSAYYQLEAWERAIAAWAALLQRDPDHGDAHLGMAMAHWRQKDFNAAWEAVSECQRVGVPIPPSFFSRLQADSGRLGPR